MPPAQEPSEAAPPASPRPEPTEAEVDAALTALSEPGRLHAAEARVARFAPDLQRILAGALQSGGWFDEAHESHLRKVAEAGDVEALRTLLAEETRLGMLVGVAVGWELGLELEGDGGRGP